MKKVARSGAISVGIRASSRIVKIHESGAPMKKVARGGAVNVGANASKSSKFTKTQAGRKSRKE